MVGFTKKIAKSGFVKRAKKAGKLFAKADKFVMNHGDDILNAVGKGSELIGSLTG